MSDFSIVSVTQDNLAKLGFFCVKNKKHVGYTAKQAWLQERFKEGLRLKLLITKERKQVGFLEYIPGEYTWRVVNAPGYLVIHCIWVNSRQLPYPGLGSALLEECFRDAETNDMAGVAVVTSDGPWMASQGVFIKNGFERVADAPPHFQLLVRRTGDVPPPSFPQNWTERVAQFQELELIYTNQCPYIGKAIAELPPVAEQHGIQLLLTEVKDAAEARDRLPSPYGMFCLGYQGRLLAEHPISATRFRNILQKELGIQPSDGS